MRKITLAIVLCVPVVCLSGCSVSTYPNNYSYVGYSPGWNNYYTNYGGNNHHGGWGYAGWNSTRWGHGNWGRGGWARGGWNHGGWGHGGGYRR